MDIRKVVRDLCAALSGATLASVIIALAPIAQAGALKAPTPKPPPAPKPPTAITGGASEVGDSTATLSGSVTPHGLETTYYFQIGSTTAYGVQTPTSPTAAGTSSLKVSQPLSGLQLGTTYHYRLVAVSSAGTTDGQDRTFTTKRIPLRFLITPPRVGTYGRPFSLTGTLSGTGAPGQSIALQANPFPYLGNFVALGQPTTTGTDGNFSIVVPALSQTTELRLSTLDTTPTFSQVVTVHVAVNVSAFHVHATAQPGLVRFSGIVRPAEPGAVAVFQEVRSYGGAIKVGSATLGRSPRNTSRFNALVYIRRTGRYRALVQVTNGKQVSGSSQSVLLHGAPPAPRSHRTVPHRR